MSGFTILEFLVTIGLMAIMATISAPNISRMLARSKFDGEVQKFLSTIADVRANALSNKKCTKSDGSKASSVSWAVRINKTAAPFSYSLHCFLQKDYFDVLNPLKLDSVNVVVGDAVFFSEEVVKDFNLFYDTPLPIVSGNDVLLNYWSGMPQVTIVNDHTGTPERKEDVRIVAEGSFGDIKTICVNRIAGFPTFNKDGNVCIE